MNTNKQIARIDLVLRTLKEWGEPMLKTELVIMCDEEQNYSYMIGLLDGLCFGGYINFEQSELDARLCWVSITEKGKRWIEVRDAIPF